MLPVKTVTFLHHLALFLSSSFRISDRGVLGRTAAICSSAAKSDGLLLLTLYFHLLFTRIWSFKLAGMHVGTKMSYKTSVCPALGLCLSFYPSIYRAQLLWHRLLLSVPVTGFDLVCACLLTLPISGLSYLPLSFPLEENNYKRLSFCTNTARFP